MDTTTANTTTTTTTTTSSKNGRVADTITMGTRYRITSTTEQKNKKWFRISFDTSDDTTSPQNLKARKKQKTNNQQPPSNHSKKVSSEQKATENDATTTTTTALPTAAIQNDIPESVLQYERQFRKVRASYRASKTNVNIHDHLHTIYSDEHVVVTNKPSGILCVPGVNKNRSLLDLVFEEYGDGKKNVVAADDEKDEDKALSSLEGAAMSSATNTAAATTTAAGTTEAITTLFPRDSMIVHRLDMDTSGIVIFARNRMAMSKLHKSFRERIGTKKVYEALLLGWLDIDKWIDSAEDDNGDSQAVETENKHTSSNNNNDTPNLGGGEINLPLQRDHRHPPFMRVSTPESESEALRAVLDLNHAGYKKLMAKNPKPSTTHFRILSHESWFGHEVTRVELTPITGRTHQLRVHCAAVGHPILGDSAYGFCGEAHPNGGFTDEVVRGKMGMSPTCATFELRRDAEETVRKEGRTMCLHARRLTVDHPVTGEDVLFEAAPSF